MVVFLEKDKLRKRSEDLEAALKQGNQALVASVEGQKEHFTHIADLLEVLSKDSAKSANSLIVLSSALTESSAVGAKALGGVTEGLKSHVASVSASVEDLSRLVSKASSDAITELSGKASESLRLVAEEVKKVEAAQVASSEAATKAIDRLAEEVSSTNKTIRDLEATLKSTVTL